MDAFSQLHVQSASWRLSIVLIITNPQTTNRWACSGRTSDNNSHFLCVCACVRACVRVCVCVVYDTRHKKGNSELLTGNI